ncbi:hypothetical protein [Pseudomonas putida]|uniref:Uncharacterized protein n=1 Tax=Pseudomonas putida TaxID=303 RepID=A0A8I1JKJ0_PSEPU|nr:hypothetical protein [Pseudomonas putida]MBI6885098.1 hypothetical protein [Pseudomonas putida]
MVDIAIVEFCAETHTSRGLQEDISPQVMLPIAALESEGSIADISVEDLGIRVDLVKELRKLPADALANIRHFQTQVGCLNRCGFCSQGAGKTLWNMPRQALANLIAALKTVCLEHAMSRGLVVGNPLDGNHVFSTDFVMPALGLLGDQRKDRPGVIYCYLDNDPAAYPHLDDMIQWLHEDLGVKVRIATVGYSRRNLMIQQMHERISEHLRDGLAGLRLSFSPYTYGWTSMAEGRGDASRDEFEQDTAALLSTYRTLFISRKGRKGACTELRFRPLIDTAPVEVATIDGRLTIRCESYLVIQAEPDELPVANITDAKSHSNDLDVVGSRCFVIRAEPHVLENHADALVGAIKTGASLPVEVHAFYEALLHRLKNDDGEYFAVDAERTAKGVFSKFFYPHVGSRPKAGMIDGERYHLNAMMAAKLNGQCSTWEDVDSLLNGLLAKASSLESFDAGAAKYIRTEVVDLLQSYVRVLKIADYPSTTYFDKEQSVDTGHICNLGRAYSEYKTIASRPDLPLTPKHERAFGPTGELAEEGIAWRLAVTPQDIAKNACGERNTYQEQPSILIEKLDLAMTATSSGQSQARYFIRTQPIQRITLRDSMQFPVIPGHLPRKQA